MVVQAALVVPAALEAEAACESSVKMSGYQCEDVMVVSSVNVSRTLVPRYTRTLNMTVFIPLIPLLVVLRRYSRRIVPAGPPTLNPIKTS